MYNKFTENAQMAIEAAKSYSRDNGIKYIGTEQLLYGILKVGDCKACEILLNNGVTLSKYEGFLKKTLNKSDSTDDITPRSKRVFDDAREFSNSLGNEYVGMEHILFAILKDGDSIATNILKHYMGVDVEKALMQILESLNTAVVEISYEDLPKFMANYFEDFSTTMSPNKAKSSQGATAKINKFGEDLTQKAKQGKIDPVIGRQAEIDRIIQVLCRKTKNNPVLVGEPGTGKSAVVEGLAIKIANNDVPEPLKNKIIFSLNIGNLIAGTKYRGEFEENFKTVIDEIKNNNDIILYIDEIHNIVGAGSTSESSMDAGEMLKPMLSRGEMQTIGATTLDEYRRYIEKDGALERRFQPIKVEPPSVEETIQILHGIKDKYEAHHKVVITDEAIIAAATLSDRYITDRFLPDKAIDLIDEAASRARLAATTSPNNVKELEEQIAKLEVEKKSAVSKEDYASASKFRDEIQNLQKEIDKQKTDWKKQSSETSTKITDNDIADIVSNWTAIPVAKLTEEEGKRLLNLESYLHKRVIGQSQAVSSISKAIRRARAGLKDPKRPIGSFILVGPTGVGKTELTKALAEAMFGDENLMIRIDMSEYMEGHSVSKLIGAPPGYVGFDSGGQLTEKVRRKPYSVVLFDEIEKAHPDVFNMLLQILDDGRLSDSQGRTIDFKNTVIIMTSNIGARNISANKKLGFSSNDDKVSEYDNMKDVIMQELKKTFRPEFLNRIDDIIVFHKLDRESSQEIAKIMIESLAKRLAEKGMTIRVEDKVIEYLAEKGFDEEYGARPLRRIIQKELEDSLAEQILSNKVSFNDKIIVTIKDGKLNFSNKK